MEFESKTVAFLAVAAFLCLLFLFCIVLSILFYIKYRHSDETNRHDKENKERARIQKFREQLAKQFQDELKKHTNKKNKHGKVVPMESTDDASCAETSCSICLDSLTYGDASSTVLALLTNCGHVYHMDCVWPWLEKDHSCPICRREMQLNTSSLRAVTIHHVFKNFDVPSIRESVSRADLHSRMGIDCVEVVSIDAKSPRTTVIPVAEAARIEGQDSTEVRGEGPTTSATIGQEADRQSNSSAIPSVVVHN